LLSFLDFMVMTSATQWLPSRRVHLYPGFVSSFVLVMVDVFLLVVRQLNASF